MHAPLTQKHPQHKQTQKEQKTHLSLVVRAVKSIAQTALPMILTGLLLYCRSMISMLFLGRLGKLALAGGFLALGFANIIGYCILSGLAMGMEPICSQTFGAKKHALLTGLLLYCLSMISMLFLGCLGELALAGGSLALGFANITGYCILSCLAMGMEPICSQAFGAKKHALLTGLLLYCLSMISMLFLGCLGVLALAGGCLALGFANITGYSILSGIAMGMEPICGQAFGAKKHALLTGLLLYCLSMISMLFLGCLSVLALAGGSLALGFANITGYSILSGIAMGMEPICGQAFGAKKHALLTGLLFYCRSMISMLFLGCLSELALAGGSLALGFANITGYCILSCLAMGMEPICSQAFGAKKHALLTGLLLYCLSMISMLFLGCLGVLALAGGCLALGFANITGYSILSGIAMGMEPICGQAFGAKKHALLTGLLLYCLSMISMLFLGCLGVLALAGGSLALGFANITGYSILSGIAMGMEPICGQAFGAKKHALLTGLLFYCRSMISMLFLGCLSELALAGGSLALGFANITGYCILSCLAMGMEPICSQAFGAKKHALLTGLLIYCLSMISMLFLGCLGVLALAGGSLALGFANITGYSILSGIAMGMEPICGQAFGAKKHALLTGLLLYCRSMISMLFLGCLSELALAGGSLALGFANITSYRILSCLAMGMEPICSQAFGAKKHALLTGLLLYCLSMISILFLGRLGELALAGGSLAALGFANITGYSILSGLAMGMEPICSQAFSAKKHALLTGLLLYCLSMISMISMLLLGRLSELALAGGSLALGFANITGYSILSGLAMGMEPICSQALGAKKHALLTGLLLYRRTMISMLFLGCLGELALAGGSLALGFANITGYSILSGLAMAKKHALLGLSLQRTLLLLMSTSLPISFLWLNMKRILLFCGQDEAIATEAPSFLLYTIPDLLALSILHPLRIYLRSQSTTLPLTFCATLSILLHIPINLLLVTHLGLGIKGVALGGVWTDFNLVASLVIYILISGVHEKTWGGLSSFLDAVRLFISKNDLEVLGNTVFPKHTRKKSFFIFIFGWACPSVQSRTPSENRRSTSDSVQASEGAPAGEVGHMRMNSSLEDHMELAFIFGLSANILSVLGLLSSITTLYTIFKKKSSDGYASTPYVVALFRASLLLYYGILKTDAMAITFNAIVIVIEIAFPVLVLIYASTKEKMYTVWLLLFNIGGFGATVALTMFLIKGQERINAVGWICMAFNLAAFALPLSIMWRVIKTKSVEFMPFIPSLFPTLSAIAWFCNGLIVKDLKIALPNAVGFVLGVIQIIVYLIYKDGNKKTEETNERNNQQEVSLDMEKLTPIHQPQVAEMGIFTSGKPIEPNNTV